MAMVGRFLRRTATEDGYSARGYAHWCPGCEEMHPFAVDEPQRNGARWSFDGDEEHPSFLPSMNIRIGPFPDGRMEICHYFLKAGQIQFLSDSTHSLSGKTVPLPEIPEKYRD